MSVPVRSGLNRSLNSCEVGLRNDTSASIQAKASLTDLLVNLLHEPDIQSGHFMAIGTKDALYDKIDKLVLEHILCMEVGYEEGNVVPLEGRQLSRFRCAVGFGLQRLAFV
jgi:hypothetical protein